MVELKLEVMIFDKIYFWFAFVYMTHVSMEVIWRIYNLGSNYKFIWHTEKQKKLEDIRESYIVLNKKKNGNPINSER